MSTGTGIWKRKQKKKRKEVKPAQPLFLEHMILPIYHIAKHVKYFSDQFDMLKYLK